MSRSDNDLRAKKSVTFLAHVIEHRHRVSHQSSASGSTSGSGGGASASSTALATPVAASPCHGKAESEAPPLQYGALIAMLKANSLQSSRKRLDRHGQSVEYHQINARFEDLTRSNKQQQQQRRPVKAG